MTQLLKISPTATKGLMLETSVTTMKIGTLKQKNQEEIMMQYYIYVYIRPNAMRMRDNYPRALKERQHE